MKNTSQISRETGITNNIILHTAKKLGIQGKSMRVKGDGKPDLFFTTDQEHAIHMNLYFELKIDHIILESKMNKSYLRASLNY